MHATSAKALVLCASLAMTALACGRTPGTATPAPPPASPTAAATLPAHVAPLTIAVEYGVLGVAKDYAATGVTYAKPQLVYGIWGNLEPERGRYVWGPLDAVVQEYEAAGFTGLQILLSAESPWAASRQPKLGDLGDTFPQAQYLDDYKAFVTRVVERYDADGTDDMPRLLYPIRHYGIEREFTGFWPGTADEYVRLLHIAYPAVKAADPQAEVLLVALLVGDAFDGAPGPEESDRRLATTPSFRKSLADIRTILAACDAYDIVDFHSLGDYTEIPPTADWIRAELARNGCGDRPIWIGDAFPMSGLVGFGGFVAPIPFDPVTAETRDAVVALLKAVADPNNADHDAAQAWLYAETARGLVKKIAVSAGAGLAGINIGNLEDWKTGVPAADALAVPSMGASMFMGLMDTTITSQRPGGSLPYSGHLWSQARKAGAARPGFYALKLAYATIGSFTAVEQLDLGPGVWAYRFDTAHGSAWVLWYDDGKLYLPGQAEATIAVQLPFDAARAQVTRTPTRSGDEGTTMEVAAQGGKLALIVGTTPVFVQ